jgi:cysteinyl-tRNA synthetase
MSIKYLGERFDIHTGGIDHVPVHHTNERAQNFAATGKEVVVRWMHNAFLVIGDTRMGKSEGNLVTISELEKRGVSPAGFRYLCHTALYRMPLSFTAESLQSAQNSLRGIVDFGRNAQAWPVKDAAWTEPLQQEFREAIADDLNIPQGLAVVWNLVREGNRRQDRAAWDALVDFDRVLGLGLAREASMVQHAHQATVRVGMTVSASSFVAPPNTPEDVIDLARLRLSARSDRNWAEADQLRKLIADKGYIVEDTPGGFRLKPRS